MRMKVKAKSLVEPTCGQGGFIFKALKQLPDIQQVFAVDINQKYVEQVSDQAIRLKLTGVHLDLAQADFFKVNWLKVIADLKKPLLILGNPPWVTNSDLGKIDSENLPMKYAMDGISGIEALTGKSNFDISQSILQKLTDASEGQEITLAVLCKTSVARKILKSTWKKGRHFVARIYQIDAKRHFEVSVNACLLVCDFSKTAESQICKVYDQIYDETPSSTLGYANHQLIADVNDYEDFKKYYEESRYRWRSGLKHDCSTILELRDVNGVLLNKLGFEVDIENEYVYPLLKSSDLNKGNAESDRYVIVTQRKLGDQTKHLEKQQPKLWRYLTDYQDYFSKRKSSVYKNQPLFAIFGVGPYSFSKWKIGISGLYKAPDLNFVKIPPINDIPVMLDDTSYFLACENESEMNLLFKLLKSDPSKRFYNSMIFWDEKRPIKSTILNSLNLQQVAQEYGFEEEFLLFCNANPHVMPQKEI